MFIAVRHNINNIEEFWRVTREVQIPGGLFFHSIAPNNLGSKANSVWQAESFEFLQEFLNTAFGSSSENEYFEIDMAKATGLVF